MKRRLISLLPILFGLMMAVSLPAQAQVRQCTGTAFECATKRLKDFASNSGVKTDQTPTSIVGQIINTAVGMLGVVAVGLIVYAGGLWITAAGNDDKVETAKGIIKNTVIGMIVLGLAYAITIFIVSFIASPRS